MISLKDFLSTQRNYCISLTWYLSHTYVVYKISMVQCYLREVEPSFIFVLMFWSHRKFFFKQIPSFISNLPSIWNSVILVCNFFILSIGDWFNSYPGTSFFFQSTKKISFPSGLKTLFFYLISRENAGSAAMHWCYHTIHIT